MLPTDVLPPETVRPLLNVAAPAVIEPTDVLPPETVRPLLNVAAPDVRVPFTVVFPKDVLPDATVKPLLNVPRLCTLKPPLKTLKFPVTTSTPFLNRESAYVLSCPLIVRELFNCRLFAVISVKVTVPAPLCVKFPSTVTVESARVEGIVGVPTGGG